MKYFRLFTISTIVILAITLVPVDVVQAFPPLPSSFYGSIKQNGGNLSAGTPIQALINNQVFATSTIEIYQGESVYSLTVPGDDPGTVQVEGGQAGDTISFRINGELADQTGTWESGTNVSLNLTLNTNPNVVTPTPAQPTPTRTVPVGTVTSTPTRRQELTIQEPALTEQSLSLTATEDEEESLTLLPIDAGSTQVTENLISTQSPGSSLSVIPSGDETGSEPSNAKDLEGKEVKDGSRIWLVIGIPIVVIIGIASGVWYITKHNKPDQELL
jgi:hypothetical protein